MDSIKQLFAKQNFHYALTSKAIEDGLQVPPYNVNSSHMSKTRIRFTQKEREELNPRLNQLGLRMKENAKSNPCDIFIIDLKFDKEYVWLDKRRRKQRAEVERVNLEKDANERAVASG